MALFASASELGAPSWTDQPPIAAVGSVAGAAAGAAGAGAAASASATTGAGLAGLLARGGAEPRISGALGVALVAAAGAVVSVLATTRAADFGGILVGRSTIGVAASPPPARRAAG